MERNKTAKYFKYAIGEIVLVVIGILIALQINTWNEERKSNNLLKKYEKNIIVELKTDLLKLDELDSIHKTWRNSLLNYLDYYNTKNPDINILKSKRDSSKTGLTTPFHTSTYSIQDLISTGNLKLFPAHKKSAILKYKDLHDINVFSEQESGNFIKISYAEFEQEIDLLVLYNYSEKEHSAVKNWNYDLTSPQMRLWNNVLAKFLNFYEYQLLLHEQVRKESKELIEVLGDGNEG